MSLNFKNKDNMKTISRHNYKLLANILIDKLNNLDPDSEVLLKEIDQGGKLNFIVAKELICELKNLSDIGINYIDLTIDPASWKHQHAAYIESGKALLNMPHLYKAICNPKSELNLVQEMVIDLFEKVCNHQIKMIENHSKHVQTIHFRLDSLRLYISSISNFLFVLGWLLILIFICVILLLIGQPS